jgi:hypothetical protein
MNDAENPAALEQVLSRLTDREFARNEKYGHLVLTLIGAVFAVGLAIDLLEHRWLPPATQLWVLVVIGVGLAWIVASALVLARRRPLFSSREVALGRVSLAFSILFSLASMGAHYSAVQQMSVPWFGLVLVAIAGALLSRAHLRRASLVALRTRLEKELGVGEV